MKKLVMLGLLMVGDAGAAGFLGQNFSQNKPPFCESYSCKLVQSKLVKSELVEPYMEYTYQLIKLDAKVIYIVPKIGKITTATILARRSPPDENTLKVFQEFGRMASGLQYGMGQYEKCFAKLNANTALEQTEDSKSIASADGLGINCVLWMYQNSGVTGIRVFFGM